MPDHNPAAGPCKSARGKLAAAAQGKSRTEFRVESARLYAIDVLLDQRIFTFDAGQTAAVADVLANPPRTNAVLRDLMYAPSPWA